MNHMCLLLIIRFFKKYIFPFSDVCFRCFLTCFIVTTYQKSFSKTVPTCGSDNLIKSQRHLFNKALFHFCCKTRCVSALEVFLHEIKSMTHTHPFDDLSKLRRTTKEHFHFAFPFLGYFVKNLQNKTLYQRVWYKEKRGLF